MGPVSDGWRVCYGCNQLIGGGAPPGLEGRVIPMSVAQNPSPWYSRLVTYKKFQPEHRVVLAGLLGTFILAHRQRIEELLGGTLSALVPVPSKRGVSFADQPLRQTLSMIVPFRELVRPLIECKGDGEIKRQRYNPAAFNVDPAVRGQRIVLIEDLWVSGATAASAAGALLTHGANVIVLPIARMVEVAFYGDDHPYFALSRQPHDVAQWPR